MSDEDERDDDERDEDGDDAEGDSSDDDSGGGSSSDDSSGGSDGGASDDSSAEASGSSDGDAAVSSASASATPAKAAKGQRLSAGARLAAAKAAKAATKAAKKQARREEAGAATQTAAEREAEDRARDESAEEMLKESPLGRAATRAGEWTQANRQLTLGVLGIAAVAVLGWLGWSYYTTSQAAGAGALLAEAMRISSAEIVAADDEPDEGSDESDDDDAPTFETVDARNEAALTAYRAVSAQYPGSPAAAWARLGEGRTLLAEREYSDARDAYQSAFDTSGDESVVAWQALEGIGATYEAEQDWEHATSTYERLASLADHAYENVANYHLARMRAASGDDAAALTAFRELVDTLREESDDEGHEPPFPYVLAQADQRLRELDPSAAGAGPSLGAGPTGEGGGIDSLTPEQIQELIQRLQTKGGGTGGAPQPE